MSGDKDEDLDIDTTVETADAGASHTYPMQAGQIKKNGYVCIKGRPCKVCEVSTSKTGKHGHAKAHIVALDIFTQKKYEDICPTSHNMEVPNVTRADYQLLDIEDGGFVSLMTANGDTKNDAKLPANEVGTNLKTAFDEGRFLIVTVMSAMGEEQIVAFKDQAESA
eukprot:gnl/Hemi2/13389_TR4599_c0_g1_i1.p2 gnl/Hemi2/13389_TR4599_c0_g1~~gnl/Hemi2/13389_TR4599_c0_g1_i1.p2  ORF type:complete len:191 (-),score=84.27 gnl/Hemi2/13389_TR4599_c0_g1_i1:200-697(-)